MTNQEALKIVKSSMLMHSYRYSKEELEEALSITVKALEERPKGEWVITGKDLKREHPYTARWYYCSYCGKVNDFNQKTNYCPYCGADMRGSKENE